jgi:hypothetical protein
LAVVQQVKECSLYHSKGAFNGGQPSLGIGSQVRGVNTWDLGVEGSFGRHVEIYLHVGFDITLPCPYFMLQHLFVS